MIDLPRKVPSILVDLEDDEAEDLQIRMLTLTDREAAKIMGGKIRVVRVDGEDNLDDGEFIIEANHEKMLELFPKKFHSFDGDDVKIDGEPFDRNNEDHMESLRVGWKIKCMSKLITYAMTMDKDMVGNSRSPDGSSPTERRTTSKTSRGENSGSSPASSPSKPGD